MPLAPWVPWGPRALGSLCPWVPGLGPLGLGSLGLGVRPASEGIAKAKHGFHVFAVRASETVVVFVETLCISVLRW